MTSREEDRRREEECSRQYHKDCQRIDERLDDTKRQRRLLGDLGEQASMDARRGMRVIEGYAVLQDRRLQEIIGSFHDQMFPAIAKTRQVLAESHEEFMRVERKLSREREDREYAYRDEMRKIEKR